MFSGIVETTAKVLSAEGHIELIRIDIERPRDFNDLKVGDSVACDGVCLTVEDYDDVKMQFALAAETLQITEWTATTLKGRSMNLERSLRLHDRIHGHLVTGHVDGVGTVNAIENAKESLFLEVTVPTHLQKFFWRKGSWTVNGVSLTVNDVSMNGTVSACLIPETLKRTNLAGLKVHSRVNLEVDWMSRGLITFLESRGS